MTKKLFLAVLITVILTSPFYSYLKNEIKVLPYTMTASQPGSLVMARVGIFTLNEISGWTSPFAEVTMTSWNLARKTIAGSNGFFAFYNIPVRENTGDICFVAEDINRVANFPNCISPLIPTDNLVITNILLSPSILVTNNKIDRSKPTKASGMTFPDSEVDVHISVGALRAMPLTTDFARKTPTLPIFSVKSNKFGYYEIPLPTTKISENRIFAVSNLSSLSTLSGLSNLSSPKSNTLTFFIINNMLWIIILLLLILLAIILLLLIKKKSRALLVPENDLILSPLSNLGNLSNPLGNLSPLRNLRNL